MKSVKENREKRKIMNERKITTEEIQTWALDYMINGVATGLEGSEIEMVDKVMKRFGIEGVQPIEETPNPYFSRYPFFGEPCGVEDGIVAYRND